MTKILPGDPGYDEARRPPIVRFHDVRPAAVFRCASPAEVAEAIAFARRAGMPVAARSGGHDFEGRSSTEGVLIDLGPMSEVVLGGEGLATIGAGARLGHVYDVLDREGVTIPAGCGPDVGIAGLALGGGLGILGRQHGLTSDAVRAAEVVLADGSVVECDEQRHADLLWALRGGGSRGFGVVTSLTFQTVEAPRSTAFVLTWPHTAAATLLERWQAWAPGAPDELAASLLVNAAADPSEPPIVLSIGAMSGSEAETRELLAELGDPAGAQFHEGSFREAKQVLSGLGEDAAPIRLHSRSEFFARPLPAEANAALIEQIATGRVAGEARELDFSPWAGAYNRVAPDATAFPHRDARFLLKQGIGLGDGARASGWLDGSWTSVHAYGTGGVYPNFPDRTLEDPGRAYYGANVERLLRVKAAYDPDGFFPFP